MKKWNEAKIEELNIEQTAYWFGGKYADGGYVGDGILSGHSTNRKPEGEGEGEGSGETEIENQFS